MLPRQLEPYPQGPAKETDYAIVSCLLM
jgi:hypothetical protein